MYLYTYTTILLNQIVTRFLFFNIVHVSTKRRLVVVLTGIIRIKLTCWYVSVICLFVHLLICISHMCVCSLVDMYQAYVCLLNWLVDRSDIGVLVNWLVDRSGMGVLVNWLVDRSGMGVLVNCWIDLLIGIKQIYCNLFLHFFF